MTKRVLVNYMGRKGGGSVFAYEMTKSLIGDDLKVCAIVSHDIENKEKWKELNIEKLVFQPTYSNKFNFVINTLKFKLFGLRELKSIFKDDQIDAVYVPMIESWTHMVNSVFKHPQKIITVHDPKPHSGSNGGIDRVINHLVDRASMKADDIVILTEKFREYTEKYFKKSPDQVHVIPHGIFDYYKEYEVLSNESQYDPDRINFLFFGRITKYKGLHVLSKAYEKLSKERDNVTLTVVGNGDFDEYKEEYSRLENVTIINRWIKDEEVGSFFIGPNIVTVLPYIDATQSGVIPIAMDYESVVIASNTGGLSEQVADKETGYLFEPSNADDLYEKMKYVADNLDELDSVKANAQTYIKSLSWDVLAEQLKAIIK